MPRTGFAKGSPAADSSSLNIAAATNIDDFSYSEVSFDQACPFGENLKLPFGIFHTVEGEEGARRLQELEINPRVSSGAFERKLEQAEQRAGKDIAKHIAKVSEFLSEAIVSVGGVPYADLAKAASVAPRNLAERWYLPDVIVAVLACRDKIQGHRQYACITQCPCEKNERIFDCPEENRPLHSIDNLNFKVLDNLDNEPLYEVTLEDGFNDSQADIKKVIIAPMKLYATNSLTSQKSKLSPTLKLLREMVVALPESKVYGQGRGRFFGEDIYDMMTFRDRKILERAANTIQAGPETQFDIECHVCFAREWTKDDINWLVLTKQTLFGSGEAPMS